MESGWLTLLYQYGIGGLVFGAGSFLVYKTKAVDFSVPSERRWFFWLIMGYFWLAGLHTLWTAMAYYVGVK